MLKPFTLAALFLAAGALYACKEGPAPTALPLPLEVPARSGADASVPSAASVMAPAMQASAADAATGRDNKTMSRAEESTAMPMAGQNNDHSAPLPPARRASGS